MVSSYEVQLANHSRTMSVEESFVGMKYTNAPLREGYMRKIINADVSNDSSALKVRMGMQKSDDPIAAYLAATTNYCVHHTGRIAVSTYDDEDAIICRYALVGDVVTVPNAVRAHGVNAKSFAFNPSNCKLIVYYNGNYIIASTAQTSAQMLGTNATIDSTMYLPMKPTWDKIHGMPIEAGPRDGVFASLDYNTYLPVQYVEIVTQTDQTTTYDVHSKLSVLKLQFNATQTAITYTVSALEPNEITALTAVSTGYNMLLDDPYTFANTSHSGTDVYIDGIVPYNADGTVATSSTPGSYVNFKVAYRYPASDLNNGETYCAMWEISDNLNPNGGTITLVPIRTGTTDFKQAFTPGAVLNCDHIPTNYTSYTLTVHIYRCSDITDTFESATMDSVNYTPVADGVVTFTQDASQTRNKASNSYDLSTCQGMCAWQNRLVVWGVKQASTTLWVSDVNDPSYFPYPNNVEDFDSEIVACMPFKSTLLVFTEYSLYQLVLSDDGGYTSNIVQSNLRMSKEDCSTTLAVQNMVFFKNGNYYYMLVPGKYASNMYGELQLAPISSDITDAFDYFSDFIEELFPQKSASLYDWWVYQEQDHFRVCYKVKWQYSSTEYKFTDVVFQYSTKTRAWTMMTYESSADRMVQWIVSSTLDSVYIAPHSTATAVQIYTVTTDPKSCVDDLPWGISTPTLTIDTGYRNLDVSHMKKYRQVQFHITTNGAQFVCNPTIYVDNMEVFNEDVSYIEDGVAYIECTNDTATDHKDMDTTIDSSREYYVADRVCIPFCGRGKQARIVLDITVDDDATYRPDIQYLTWVFRNKSGRGGRDGYGIDE